MHSVTIHSIAVAMLISIGPVIAIAQIPSAKPRTPGQIAAVSRLIAERNEGCRQQARQQKLTFFKRRRFIRDCKNASP
jgi:hypothetical protein